jgi:hypothetical protein
MSNSNPHVDRDLDLSNAGRGVWLVKVCVLDVLNIVQKSHAHTSWSKLAFILKCLIRIWVWTLGNLTEVSVVFLSPSDMSYDSTKN